MTVDNSLYAPMFCAAVVLFFILGWRYLKQERDYMTAINSYIVTKYRLGVQVELKSVSKEVAGDICRIEDADNLYYRQNGLEALWKRAVRLEGSVEFWVELLQKLGLLGTVLGLGIALLPGAGVDNLLEPLSLAVWSTVTGLLCSIAISWRFGRDVSVEVDAYEEHLKEWEAALRRRETDEMAGAATDGLVNGPTNLARGALE